MHDSIDPQIEKAKKTILGAVAKGCPKSVFLKSAKWSRIVVRDVPTQKWTVDEEGMVDEDTGASPGKFVQVTSADIEAELRKAHPLLEQATFLEGPDWTNRDGVPTGPKGNISFCIPDPDEAHLKALTRNPLLLFHTPCMCTKWIEKVKLTQCSRCWKFGDKVHPNCPIRCRRCGGTHDETEHNKSCKKCEKSDINQEDRKKGLTVCDHPIACPNCNDPHYADDSACRMRNYAACEERQRRKIGRGQTFISTYLEQQQTNAVQRIDTDMS